MQLGRNSKIGVAFWELPGVLSLEAPLVAVLWQRLLAQTLGVPLGWPQTVLLGAGVWLVYAADRWLDARSGGLELSPRHRFYRRYRLPVAALWLVILAVSVGVALTWLGALELSAGLALTALALAYLLRRHGSRGQPVKELEVAGLFGLGGGFFLLFGGAPPLPLLGLLGLLAPFTALCFVNVALVGLWEGDERAVPLAVQFPGLERTLPFWTFVLAGGCLLLAVFSPYRPVYLAAALSALLLGLLAKTTRFRPATRHVLADAALLTPMLFLGWA